jgi:hypothetical protein
MRLFTFKNILDVSYLVFFLLYGLERCSFRIAMPSNSPPPPPAVYQHSPTIKRIWSTVYVYLNTIGASTSIPQYRGSTRPKREVGSPEAFARLRKKKACGVTSCKDTLLKFDNFPYYFFAIFLGRPWLHFSSVGDLKREKRGSVASLRVFWVFGRLYVPTPEIFLAVYVYVHRGAKNGLYLRTISKGCIAWRYLTPLVYFARLQIFLIPCVKEFTIKHREALFSSLTA